MRFLLGGDSREVAISDVIVAGWTGRDRAMVDHHVKELAVLGVAPPSMTPLYYRVSNDLLTQADAIDVLGEDTSGEAEPLVLKWEGRLWLGVGSDHTDRKLEAYSVPHSKQVCAKPVSPSLWAFDEVRDHLDELQLNSWICENGEWVDYQSGTLEHILPLAELIDGAELKDGAAMVCGTLPALGGIRPAGAFRMQIADPRLNRRITSEYQVRSLPVIV